MSSHNWVRIPVVAGFVDFLCGANIAGNIISAEKRCNYPGRSRVTRLVIHKRTHNPGTTIGRFITKSAITRCVKTKADCKMNAVFSPAQMKEGSVAELAEVGEMFAPRTPHPFHHLPGQLHGRRHGLRIPSKDVAKVNVEQFPWR